MNAKFKIIILIKKYLKNVLLVMEYAIIQKEIIMGNGKMTKKKV